MLLLCLTLFVSAAACHKVVESTEDTDPDSNTTTLYPVSSNNNSEDGNRIKSATTWKIETTFVASTVKPEDTNSSSSKEDPRELDEKTNSSKEFRPSPQLDTFYENYEVAPTRETFDSFSSVIKKPPTGFIGSHDDFKSSINKIPKDIFKNYKEFPYSIENPILTRAKDNWKPFVGTSGKTGTIDSKPTAEIPVRVPAGSLYKTEDPFRDKPDGEFGLEFSNDFKDTTAVKKRANPWKNLMYLITSLIPVGIIFSALTPNIVTIHPDGVKNQYPGHIFRRADTTVPTVELPPPRPQAPPKRPPPATPPISERCRRRLLCELQNDAYYAKSSDRPRPCYRIRCEDPAALSSTLHYLLHYQQAASAAFQQKLKDSSSSNDSSGDTFNIADYFT